MAQFSAVFDGENAVAKRERATNRGGTRLCFTGVAPEHLRVGQGAAVHDMALRPYHTLALCAGAGGLELGVELAVPDARCVAYVEREPMRPEHWSRAWKRESWLRHLSGLTSPPSTLDHGVAAFIASLPEIHASPTASPDAGSALQTSGSSSTKSSACSTTAGLIVSSARTSRGMRTGSSPPSSRLWKEWVAALRLASSARAGWAPATGESDCSSWPTATVSRGEYTSETTGERKPKLNIAARNWSTPAARLGDRRGAQAKRHEDPGRHNAMNLDDQVAAWPTPAARDWRSDHAQKSDEELYGSKGAPLPRVAACRFYAPAQPTPGGPISSPERRTLNPLFVEWLMDWPIGWTDCASAVTGFTRWQQDMRGLLSTLCSPKMPAQGRLL